jgi:hypothetical protein
VTANVAMAVEKHGGIKQVMRALNRFKANAVLVQREGLRLIERLGWMGMYE